jgi:hypothetical protein
MDPKQPTEHALLPDDEDRYWGADKELWAQIELGRRETHRTSLEELKREFGID